MASGDVVALIPIASAPATAYATQDTRAGGSTPAEAVPVFDFDDTTIEYMDFYGRLDGYAGGGLTLTADWSATDTTVTPHSVVWGAAIRRIADDAEDVDDAHAYDFNDAAADQEASASGEVSRFSIAFTSGADMDSLANGEAFILRIRRDPTNGSDDLTGDAELHIGTILLKET